MVDGEVLEWSENVAFGLVRGAHIFRVHQQRPQRRWGILPGRAQTQVLLSLEVAGAWGHPLGPGAALLPGVAALRDSTARARG